MNEYYISMDIGMFVQAETEKEAMETAYELISASSNLDLDDYTITKISLQDTGIENKCFSCGKIDIGGSNDEMCPICFKQWSDQYEKDHPKQ